MGKRVLVTTTAVGLSAAAGCLFSSPENTNSSSSRPTRKPLDLSKPVEVNLAQSCFRDARGLLTAAAVFVAGSLPSEPPQQQEETFLSPPSKQQVMQLVSSMMTVPHHLEEQPQQQGLRLLPNSSTFHLFVNLAGAEESATIACSELFVQTLGKIAQHEKYAAKLAESATRYGKKSLLNISMTHEKDQRLGRVLRKLVRDDNKNCRFGPANLISLMALVSSKSIPDEYREFAWWALSKTMSSESQAKRYKFRKRILGDDRVSKTRRTLLNNTAFWNSLENIHQFSQNIQIQALNALDMLSREEEVIRTASIPRENLKSIVHWLASNNVLDNEKTCRLALQVLNQFAVNDDLRTQLIEFGLLNNLLLIMRKFNSPNNAADSDTNTLLLECISRLSSSLDGNMENFPLNNFACSSYDSGSSFALEDNSILTLVNDNSNYLSGWIDIMLQNVFSNQIGENGRNHAINVLKNLVVHGKHSESVLQEWLVNVMEHMVSCDKIPVNLRKSNGVQLARSRTRPVERLSSKNTEAILQEKFSAQTRILSTLCYFCSESDSGNFSFNDEFFRRGGRELLLLLAKTPNLLVMQQVACLVANMLSSASCNDEAYNFFSRNPIWRDHINEWCDSSDAMLQSYGMRVRENLINRKQCTSLCYMDGVNPLHLPFKTDGFEYVDHLATDEENDRYGSWKQDADVDIVLIHGLMGCAFGTWRNGDNIEDEGEEDKYVNVNRKDMWPSTWLVNDLVKESSVNSVRVLSVSYEANVFSSSANWPVLSLSERAEVMVEKLRRAGVGTGKKPVIFLTHSMGGILLKEMLHQVKNSSGEDGAEVADFNLLSNTKSIVFFGVPHHGSPVATLNKHSLTKAIFETHPAVADLHGSPHLELLNDNLKSYSHIDVLSVGETVPVKVPFVGWEQIVVPESSSNPGMGEFILADKTNHIDVCKPNNHNDIRYTSVRDFVLRSMKN